MAAKNPGPTLVDYKFDPRFGVLFKTETTAKDREGLVGGLIPGTGGIVRTTEVKSQNTDQSYEIVTSLPALPDTQVFYGRRREQLPLVLKAVAIVGTETKDVAPTYAYPPEGLMKSRTTRTFNYGPFDDPGDLDPALLFQSQAYHNVIEYVESKGSTTVSAGTHTSDETSSGDSTESSENTSVGSDSSTSVGTSESTSSGTRSGTNESSSDDTHNSDSTSTSENTSEGTHSNTETSTHESTSDQTDEGTHHSDTTTSTEGDDTTVTSNEGAPLVGDPQNNRHTTSLGKSTTDSASSTTSAGTSTGTSITTSDGTTNSTTSNVGGDHSEGTSNSTSTGTSSGTSEDVSNGTSNNTSDSTHNSESSTTAAGTRSGTTSGSGSGTSDTSSTTTGKSLLHVDFPPTLHAEIVTGLFTIPATVPTNLPWGDWYVVADNSDHWINGIWFREVVEVLLPAEP